MSRPRSTMREYWKEHDELPGSRLAPDPIKPSHGVCSCRACVPSTSRWLGARVPGGYRQGLAEPVAPRCRRLPYHSFVPDLQVFLVPALPCQEAGRTAMVGKGSPVESGRGLMRDPARGPWSFPVTADRRRGLRRVGCGMVSHPAAASLVICIAAALKVIVDHDLMHSRSRAGALGPARRHGRRCRRRLLPVTRQSAQHQRGAQVPAAVGEVHRSRGVILPAGTRLPPPLAPEW